MVLELLGTTVDERVPLCAVPPPRRPREVSRIKRWRQRCAVHDAAEAACRGVVGARGGRAWGGLGRPGVWRQRETRDEIQLDGEKWGKHAA